MYVCYLRNTSTMSFLPFLLFSVFVTCVFSVETDVVEFVSVFVGDSLTLHTNLPQIQSDDVIQWRFRGELTARINNLQIKCHSDRVKLDSQTGDLTIRNIRYTDSGLHKLAINSFNGSSTKTFNITCVGVIGVKVVSVLDRDSAVLPTGLNKIGRDDRIILRYKGNVTAQINPPPYLILDERFKKRLRLIPETGSLIITNVRAEISGFYELNINKISGGFTTHKEFSLRVVDGENALSVMEGNSVTLDSGIDKIHRDDVITWRFEHEDSVIVNISDGSFTTSDGADGRFTGRLELDDKNGSLTIRNIKTTHAGLYHLDITGNRRTIFKRIRLYVYPGIWSLPVFTGICVFFLLGFTVAVAVIYCGNKICGRKKRGYDFSPQREALNNV